MTATLETPMVPSIGFTVSTHDAHRWFKASLVCAGKDDTLPMLTHVQLKHVGNTLLLTSTDRFRLGVVRIEALEDVPTFEPMILNGKDVKQAATVLKAVNAGTREVPVTFTIEDREITYRRADGIGGVIRIEDVDFPGVDRLLTMPNCEDDLFPFEVNSTYLADFAKVRFETRDNIGIYPGTGPGKPVRVKVGNHFVGLIMPVRVPDNNHTATWDTWSGLLG